MYTYESARTERRVCVRCVIDEGVPETTFDQAGICSWCHLFDERARRRATRGPMAEEFAELIRHIKTAGRGKPYDCVLGVSGGADSSYAALVARRVGLRPLAIHVDNGWNSELAVKNIEVVVRGLNLDLITKVIDWEEFRGLQLSLLRAGVVDLELVSDHAIAAAMFDAARRHHIKYIVTGDNDATEATLPRGWNHRKTDLANIRSINRAFECASMRTFPHLSTFGMLLHQRVLGIRKVGILSYGNYVKHEAEEELERELGWRRYAKKHFESVITRFYQGYILPTKFGIDKRKFHYSLLIHSKQMSRDEALVDLERPPYDPSEQERDKVYVCKKLGISIVEFDRMMSAAPRSHYEYATDEPLLRVGLRVKRELRRLRGMLSAGSTPGKV